jgi:hypothetical protein
MHDIKGLKFQESINTSTISPAAHYALNSAIMTENNSRIATFEETRKKNKMQSGKTQATKSKSKDATRLESNVSSNEEFIDYATLSELPVTGTSSNRAIVLKMTCTTTPEKAVRQLFNTARFRNYKTDAKAVIQVTHTETQCRLMLRRSEQA